MKIALTIFIGLAGLAFRVQPADAQGSLTSPGPPAAEMLTLSQVQPRTPVDAAHTPGPGFAEFAISNSGSYYLTANISSAGQTAIYIVSNNVTLDLNGFSLLGSPAGGAGVYIAIGCTNISVHDGIINGFGGNGIYSYGAGVVLDHLTVNGNTGGGILFAGPGGSMIRNCTVNGNTAYGIYCLANNVTLDQLVVSSNNPGVFFSGVGSGVLKNSTVNQNATTGVECYASTNVTLEDLTASQNNGYGMFLSSVQNSEVCQCKINGNDSSEAIYLLGTNCFLLGNSCSGSGVGIFVQGIDNQIDGNHVVGSNPSTVGILIENVASQTNNIVIRNFVTGYGAGDYSIGPGQIVGPIINTVVSGTITNSNPWGNFAY